MFSTPTSAPAPLLAEARELAGRRDWSGLAARLRSAAPEALLAEPEVAFLYADACRRTGETERALEVGLLAEARVRLLGDHRLLLRVLNGVGMTLFELGRVEEADQYFSQLLESATEWENEGFAARASNNLGVLANVRGRRDVALNYYQRALACYHRLGEIRGLAQTHYNLGISYRDLGFPSEADSHYARAIDQAEAASSEDVVALAETERALLRARAGDGELAESMARRALERLQRIGDPTGAAQAVRVLAAAARVRGQDEAAAELLASALATARTHSDPLLHAEVQRDRGVLLRDLGELDAAREALRDALTHFERLGAEAEIQATEALLAQLDPPPPSDAV